MLGTVETVLVEGLSVKRKNEVFGRSDNNRVVNFKGTQSLIGSLVDVHIDEVRGNTLHGTQTDVSLEQNIKYEQKIL